MSPVCNKFSTTILVNIQLLGANSKNKQINTYVIYVEILSEKFSLFNLRHWKQTNLGEFYVYLDGGWIIHTYVCMHSWRSGWYSKEIARFLWLHHVTGIFFEIFSKEKAAGKWNISQYYYCLVRKLLKFWLIESKKI